MAIERSKDIGGRPDRFQDILHGLAEQDPGGLKELRNLGKELDGIHGPLAERVARWNRQGLGRAIRVPWGDTSSQENDDRLYRNVAYALPLTDESVKGHDRRILLIFAAEGEQNLYEVLGPKQSNHPTEDVRTIENEDNLHKFDALFRPSDKPSDIPDLRPKPGKGVLETFFNNKDKLPIHRYTQDYQNEGTKPVEQAEATARRMKMDRLPINELALKEKLDPTLLAEVEVIERDWELLKRDENYKKIPIYEHKNLNDKDAA